ncbi:MAG: GntR family transcriptional regulator [Thermoanaerobacterales bacterium]|nr:GntR family transcriptional regulator [Bacillota bacterium]MDI6907255.1 GntR family transcriptional regulator [Thermoanaerobacterales bacterium]
MQLLISQHNPVPLYQQIVEQVRDRIMRGELAPGEPLPSIRELARELVTSVITTKRAYLELEREGLIVTRQGVGSFVAAVDPAALAAARRKAARELLRRAVERARETGVGDRDIARMVEEILAVKEGEKE